MTNEKTIATAETTPATATEKKANAKKEGKTAMKIETAPAPAEIETKKAEITAKISELLIRGKEVAKINKVGSELNATNWSKDTTSTGNGTLGGFVRGLLKQYADEIGDLKRDLKGLYFTLPPVLSELLKSENNNLVALAKDCMDNMRDIVVIKYRDYITSENLQALQKAGIEKIGVTPELLGDAIPVLGANGYVFEAITQPVTIEEKQIEGLDKIPACTYYSFKKA